MEMILNFDNAILDFIQTYMRNGFLDFILPIITKLGNDGILWILIAIAFLISKKYRASGVKLAIALLLCLIIGNITLKPLIARIRPFDINTEIELLITKPTDFSFPSGHTMSSFAAAIVIYNANKRMGIIALILASLIAFSRLYLYVHFPSDVLAGLVIGVINSIIAIKCVDYFIKNNRKHFI